MRAPIRNRRTLTENFSVAVAGHRTIRVLQLLLTEAGTNLQQHWCAGRCQGAERLHHRARTSRVAPERGQRAHQLQPRRRHRTVFSELQLGL